MKVKIRGVRKIFISGEFIKLDALLKFISVASSGGEAKILIQSGDVSVGGKICVQRGRKVKPGEIVRCRDFTFLVKQAPAHTVRTQSKSSMVDCQAATGDADSHLCKGSSE